MIHRRRFLAISAAACAVSAGASPARWSGRALGAQATITLHGLGADALQGVPAVLHNIERLFSLYDPASTLVALNRKGRLAKAPAEFVDLLRHCDQMYRATDGRFDPTVQSLWTALAHGRDIAEARAAIGWDRVRITDRSVELSPGQALTLNGIAQGYATDLVTLQLRAAGAERVLVNIGEFRGTGGPWQIGLADPVADVYDTYRLRDGALATSSPGALTLSRTRDHILDPQDRTRAQWSSVTVAARDATTADAASTAFCLADRDAIARMVRANNGIDMVKLVTSDGDVTTLRG